MSTLRILKQFHFSKTHIFRLRLSLFAFVRFIIIKCLFCIVLGLLCLLYFPKRLRQLCLQTLIDESSRRYFSGLFFLLILDSLPDLAASPYSRLSGSLILDLAPIFQLWICAAIQNFYASKHERVTSSTMNVCLIHLSNYQQPFRSTRRRARGCI